MRNILKKVHKGHICTVQSAVHTVHILHTKKLGDKCWPLEIALKVKSYI